MIIKPSISVICSDRVEQGIDLHLQSAFVPGAPDFLSLPGVYAYTPLINSHDHLIGNWVPRAVDNRPYPNSHIWVEDMKNSFAFLERNKFWVNDGSFDLLETQASQVAMLGAYKNLFSGCGMVQDHAPVQKNDYYAQFPITVLSHFRQCHSITLKNWWGGESPEKEMSLSKGKIPFIIHLGEGTDEVTRSEFRLLMEHKLLKPNTLMIHGIAFEEQDMIDIAKAKASVCWCPTSNHYLIGQTLKVDLALKHGVNVTIGTDSTMSGGINLIDEFLSAKKAFPDLPTKVLYQMSTDNAVSALMISREYAKLDPSNTRNLLLIDKIDPDPFENLLQIEAENINLLLCDEVPRFGDIEWLDYFKLNMDQYTTFRTGKREKFVIGDPQALNDLIDAKLGYHKDFPYLPF